LSAHRTSDASNQILYGERLGENLFRTCLESLGAARETVPCREHEDWRGVAVPTPAAQQVQAVFVG
jgi:hypothetical protein